MTKEDDELFEPESMDDILDGNTIDELNPKPGEDVPEEGADKKADAEGDRPKGEGKEPSSDELNGKTDGDEKNKGDKPKDAPPASKEGDDDLGEKGTIPRKQAIDERRKRQAAEDRARAAEEELARHRQQPAQAPQAQQHQQQTQVAQRPDPFTDPDGAAAWDAAQHDERDFDQRCGLTRDMFMELKGEKDYLEKEKAFLEECNQNPSMTAALRRASNPAKFAYQQGKSLLAQREYGDDPGAYREKLKGEITEEIREDLRAELKAELLGNEPPAQEPKRKAQIPQSLAKETSAPAPSKDGGFAGPTPLSKLLPD